MKAEAGLPTDGYSLIYEMDNSSLLITPPLFMPLARSSPLDRARLPTSAPPPLVPGWQG